MYKYTLCLAEIAPKENTSHLHISTMSGDELERRTLPAGRVYITDDNDYLPSVSTVLDEMPTPEGIKHWKRNNDDWREILQYKGNRGTLIHYILLNEFADDDMYSADENASEEELKVEGDWHRYQGDKAYAQEAWEDIKRIRNINTDNVLNVECFVTNTSVGYAGQFDLLYVDDDSNVVLSDIKTSNSKSAPYDKHKLQLTAYSKALDLDVDLLEVIIIHPDSKSWKISHNTDWSEDVDDLWAEFVELREGMGDVEDRMKRIAEDGINDAESVERNE